jgi:uncharacterized membrane protein YadS
MIDLDNQTVQVVAICGVTAIGITAMIVDGDIGQTMAVAVATALGVLVGYLFPRGGMTDAKKV